MSENNDQDSNIITPEGMKEKKTQGPIILSKGRAHELAAILHQLRTLHAKAVVEPTDDEQKVALTSALATGLMTHADELLGCWFAVKDEYEPLTIGLAAVLRRSDAMNGALAAREQMRRVAANKIAQEKVSDERTVSNEQ